MAYKKNPKKFFKLMTMRARRDGVLEAAQIRWLDFCTGHKMFHVFKNAIGAKVGYIAWAHFGDEAILRLVRSRQLPIYEYEWTEGITHFILDVCFTDGRRRLSRSQIRDLFVRDVDKVAFIRRNEVRFYRQIAGRFTKVTLDHFIDRRFLEAC